MLAFNNRLGLMLTLAITTVQGTFNNAFSAVGGLYCHRLVFIGLGCDRYVKILSG